MWDDVGRWQLLAHACSVIIGAVQRSDGASAAPALVFSAQEQASVAPLSHLQVDCCSLLVVMRCSLELLVALLAAYTLLWSSLLLSENHELLDSLEDQLDAMRRAENSLNSIGQLMALFQSKVLEQEEQIGTIYDNAINSQKKSQHTMRKRRNAHSVLTPELRFSSNLSSCLLDQVLCTCTAASAS
jgi:hypothetical protein